MNGRGGNILLLYALPIELRLPTRFVGWANCLFYSWIDILPTIAHQRKSIIERYVGTIFLSKIAVGKARVQQALGTSTIPLILPSTGAQLSKR